jgi:diguanylate cyclase (GGDEF)-like protein
VRAVLEAAQPPPLDLTGQGSRLIEHDGRATLLTRFPLFDYAASRRGTAAPVGTVLLWRDATQEVQAHQRTKRQAMLFALFGFVLVESLLWAGVRFVTERLESEVEQRTQEVQALNVQLQAQAVTDELTGLPNRRELMRELRVQVTRAHRSGAPLSLLMFDIDHFKRVNDTHGHQAGDAVLVRVAEVVEEVRRAADRPGRYGGEEFCLVLPDTDTAGATALAERLRAAIEATPFAPASTRRLSVTVSVGVARLTPEMRARELIKAADRALYAAKAGGRNRVVLAEGVQA